MLEANVKILQLWSLWPPAMWSRVPETTPPPPPPPPPEATICENVLTVDLTELTFSSLICNSAKILIVGIS